MTTDELNDRLDDITSMGATRAKAHIKALYHDLIGDNQEHTKDFRGDEYVDIESRNRLRDELHSKVGDV